MPLIATNPATVAAKLFRGFADPTRVAILQALLDGERRVADLVEQVGSSQSNVSGHLACLKDCGLVLDRPGERRQVFYRLSGPEVIDLLRAAELGHIPVVVGGIIPPADAEALRALGVAAVYTPKDYELNRIMLDIVELVGARNGDAP